MGNYWAANHGTALVLSYEEMNDMLHKYIEQNPADVNGKESFEIWNEIINEYRNLICSKHAGTILTEDNCSAKLYFTVTDVSCAFTSGATLHPYVVNGKPNVPGTFNERGNFIPNPDHVCHKYNDDVYAIWSDKELNSAAAFVEQPYKSYDDLRQEFKNKLKTYLPDDFDWDSHIGVFDYASFA